MSLPTTTGDFNFLSVDARISITCMLDPSLGAVTDFTLTPLFALRIKRVQLRAKKKEVVGMKALIERYSREIEELKRRLAQHQAADVGEESDTDAGGPG